MGKESHDNRGRQGPAHEYTRRELKRRRRSVTYLKLQVSALQRTVTGDLDPQAMQSFYLLHKLCPEVANAWNVTLAGKYSASFGMRIHRF